MALFEDEEEAEMPDPFLVCPNADGTPPGIEDEKQRIFNVMLMHTREWDRLRVARALHKSDTNRRYLVTVMQLTYPGNNVIDFAIRELIQKVPDDLLCSILAFAHNGSGGRVEIKFPEKRQGNLPRTLLRAFGLRGSEGAWAHRLLENESFMRRVASRIHKKDFKWLIHDKATLYNKHSKEDTESLLAMEQGANV